MSALRQLRALASIAAAAAVIAAAVLGAARTGSGGSSHVYELVAVGVIAGLSLLVGLAGAAMATRSHRLERRRAAAEHAFRAAQVELAESLQAIRADSEACTLLRRHLERVVPGSEVAVLRRDGDQVEPATFVADASALARRLASGESRSCLAVRLGRSRECGGAGERLLACALCGSDHRRSLCVPLVADGEVAGSVLVERRGELTELERLCVLDSAARVSVALSGLRSLALAEARSATDGLTGLPNAHALQSSLQRMVAQASRALGTLSVVVLDLDCLQRLNEELGRRQGDRAIAAVAQTAVGLLRTSDLAGRLDGGAFALVLPDTHKDGALEVAEKVRLGVARTEVHGLAWPLSASFGVATFPDDAVHADELLRLGRAACRAAKATGRNAVEAAGTWGLDLDAEAFDF